MSWLGSIFGLRSSAREERGGSTQPAPPPVPPSPPAPDAASDATVKVAVLLDGDADYFTSAYTSKGFRGGRSAALDLRNKVHQYILSRTRRTGATQVEIIAFSFLNLAGLSSFLGPSVDLKSFAQGFNSSPYAFSMSDVGSLPQAADQAIKGHLPFLLSTCDFVLLGGTHDGGYSQTLLRLDPTTLRKKMLLLRTTSFCAERILELGLEETRFEGLFEGRDPTAKGVLGAGKACFQPPSQQPSSHSQPKPPAASRSLTPASAAENLAEPSAPTPPASNPSIPRLPPSLVPSLPPSAVAPSAVAPSAVAPSAVAPSAVAPSAVAPSAGAVSRAPTTTTQPLLSPIVETLLHFRRVRSQSRPRSADVGQHLRKIYPHALGSFRRGTEVTFKEYVGEAEKQGLIRLGRGKKIGSEWIALVDAGAGTGVVTVPGAASSAKEARQQNGEAAPRSSASEFGPLMTVLLSFLDASLPIARPLRAHVGSQLARGPFPPRTEGFKQLADRAMEEGLVRMGRGSVSGADWIELAIPTWKARDIAAQDKGRTTVARDVAPAKASTATTSTTVPDLSCYIPLLEVLLAQPHPRSGWTHVAQFLATYSPSLYPSGAGAFKRYVEGAEALGLVETGPVAGTLFRFWVQLKLDRDECVRLIEQARRRPGGVKYRSTHFGPTASPMREARPNHRPSRPSSSSYPTSTTDGDRRFDPQDPTLERMLAQGQDKALWSMVGQTPTQDYQSHPREHQNSISRKRSLEDARRVGYVETRESQENENRKRIRLSNKGSNVASSASTTRKTTNDAIPLPALSSESNQISPSLLPSTTTAHSTRTLLNATIPCAVDQCPDSLRDLHSLLHVHSHCRFTREFGPLPDTADHSRLRSTPPQWDDHDDSFAVCPRQAADADVVDEDEHEDEDVNVACLCEEGRRWLQSLKYKAQFGGADE